MFITAGGLLSAYLGIYGLPPHVFGISGPTLTGLGIIGFFSGFIVIGLGVYVGNTPHHHPSLGAIILLLSILSLVTSFYGFFFGAFVVGVIAGVFAIRAPTQPRDNRLTAHRGPEVQAKPIHSVGSAASGQQRNVQASPESVQAPTKPPSINPQIVGLIVFGDCYVIFAVLYWLYTRSADAILYAVIGGFVMLIGVGLYLGAYHFFPGSAG